MKSLGYSEEFSSGLAHYASVYADHPSKTVLFFDNLLHGTWNSYKDNSIDYDATSNSQDESMSHLHSMMSDAEAASGYGHSRSRERGLEFGWAGVFGQQEAINPGVLGQALHAMQDAMAHSGAATSEHLGFTNTSTLWSSIKMTWNDMYGDTGMAENITQSALIVLGVMRGTHKGDLNGQQLYLEGMSEEQFSSFSTKLNELGYKIDYTKETFDSHESFYSYTVTKE